MLTDMVSNFTKFIPDCAMVNVEKNWLKKQILEACIQKQQSLVDDFKNRIKALLENEGLGNEEEYDNNQQANISQNITEANLLNNALDFANREMTELQHLKINQDVMHEKAELGAVVITDKASFYVSASIEQLVLNEKTFIGLSVHSPLFQEMKGKGIGENFSYKGFTYWITDIF